MNVTQKQRKLIKQIALVFAIAIAIIALQFGISKYLVKKTDNIEVNFYEYRIAPNEIVISPETYTGGEVTVEITTQKAGLSIQYKLVGSGEGTEEWIDYTGPFSIDENVQVDTRLVSEADNFEGPVTEKEIKNIAVAKIGDVYYKTLAEAIEACPENAGDTQIKIEILTNTKESVVIPEGKNIVIDLCGATLTGAQGTDATITVNGKFNLIDSAQNEDGTLQGNGKVVSENGTAVKVSETGNFVLGTNESATGANQNINTENPVIQGATNGVEVAQNGTFEFYDGKISGKTEAIKTVEDINTAVTVPSEYMILTKQEGEYKVAILSKTATITFDKNPGETGNSENITIEYETLSRPTGAEIETLPTAQREGYTFVGWFTAKENGEQVTLETIVTQNTTYYAIWEAFTYTITYNANGGTGTTENTEATYDKEITIPANKFTPPTGYTFKEWNSQADGNGTSYNIGDKVTNLSNEQSATVQLYAIWEDTITPTTTAPTGTGTTNTITINSNQTDDGSGIDTTTIEYAIFNKDTNGDGIPDAWSDWQTANTFTNLNANTEYQVKTRVIDKDGNGPTESETGKISTSSMENGSIVVRKENAQGEVITPETNPDNTNNQNNNNLYIDITPSSTGTTTVTVKNPDGTTNTFNQSTTITTETGKYEITVETTDGTNTVTDTYYIYVDKTEPTATPTSTNTTNSITVNANAQDADSGIAEVTYTIKKGNEIIETNTTGEFTGLEDNTEYTVEITITDNAGNTTTTTETIKTQELVVGSLGFTETTSGEEFTPTNAQEQEKVWINENASIELTPSTTGTTTYEVTAPDGTTTKYTSNTQITTQEGTYKVVVTTTDGTNTETKEYYFSVEKTIPTVTINPNQKDYTLAIGENTLNISTTVTIQDGTNGSGIAISKYAWSTSNTTKPQDAQFASFTSGTEITKQAEGGKYYLWVMVEDNAGNKVTSENGAAIVSGEFNVGYTVEYNLNGGTGEFASFRKPHGQNVGLSSDKPVRDGYIFKGWTETQNSSEVNYAVGATYTKEQSATLYAVWGEVVASTTIGEDTIVYESVQEAITAAGTNSGAVVTLLKDNIQENVTVAAGQNIKLNINGKILNGNIDAAITNYGTLTITGETGTITGAGNVIVNNGTLNKTGNCTITGTAADNATILNKGTCKITEGSVTSENSDAIHNQTGELTISGGTITSTNSNAIKNDSAGKTIVTGGTITGTNGIYNNGAGTITVGTNEATPVVNTESPIINATNYGVYVNTGTFNFYDGKIIGAENNSISGTVADVADGYYIDKTTVDGVETAILKIANYEVTEGATLANVVKVGDYVNYDASSNGVKTYTSTGLAGTSISSTISTENSFDSEAPAQWRVLNIDKETGIVELVAVETTTQNLTISGGDGFVNAETALNNVGATYGQGKGATGGRNLNLQDIEKYSTFNKGEYVNKDDGITYYGRETEYTSGDFYKQIKDSNGNVTGYESVKTTASSDNPVSTTQTFYHYTAVDYIGNSDVYNMLFMKNSDTTANKGIYWLASRAISQGSQNVTYRIYAIANGKVGASSPYFSNNANYNIPYKMLPVVTLKANIQTTGKNANDVWQLNVEDTVEEVNYYSTLKEAVDSTNECATIKTLKNVEETTTAQVLQEKTIVLDLDNKVITLNSANLTNNGNVVIKGTGKITSNNADTIINNGTLKKVGNGSIENTGASNVAINNTGTLIILEGNVTGELKAINSTNGSVTLGEEDSTVHEDSLSINSNNIGVSIEGGIFNFYDGKIVAADTKTIIGNVTELPRRYSVYKTTADGKETARLSMINYEVSNIATLADVVQIGDFVNYDASSNGAKTYTSTGLAGTSISGTISTNNSFNSAAPSQWRVLSIDKQAGVVELVAADTTSQKVTLNGIDGYVNSKTVLNNIGAIYGQGKGATEGRSISLEDVEQYSTYNKETFTSADGNYGNTSVYTLKTPGNTSVNLAETEVQKLTGSTSNPATLTQTFYLKKQNDNIYNSKILNTLFRKGNDDSVSKAYYWFATQSVVCSPVTAGFTVHNSYYEGTNNYVHGSRLYYSDGTTRSESYGVLPVVKLQVNIETTGKDANGVWQLKLEDTTIPEPIYCDTLESAIQNAKTGSTIKVLRYINEVSTATIPEEKGIVIELNGQSLILTGASIVNNGALTIKGNGTIASNTLAIIENNGFFKKAGNGTITYTEGSDVTINNTGMIRILEGTITGKQTAINSTNGIVTLGENDGTVSTEKPVINATNTGISIGGGIFNFYDGIITAADTKTIIGNVTNVPVDYVIKKTTVDGIETAILAGASYKVTNDANLADIAQIGDFVNYDASSNGEKTYTSTAGLAGTSISGTISTQNNFNSAAPSQWRILSINKETGIVELVAADPTSQTVTLNGIDGYANSKTVLNNIGAIYGQGKGAIEGRSISLEDVEKYSSYNKATFTSTDGNYGDSGSYTLKTPGNTSVNLTGTEVQKLTGSTSNPAALTQTFYFKKLNDYMYNSKILNTLFRKGNDENTSKSTYWFATQSVVCGGNTAAFTVQNSYSEGTNNYVHGARLYYSNGTTRSEAKGVLPVVKLQVNIQTTGKDSNGVWQLKVNNDVTSSSKYLTLQEAINNASAYATITALKDVEEQAMSTIPEEKEIVLDLNNHTIQNATGTVIQTQGRLTITGAGKISTTSTEPTLINAGSKTLTVNSGELSSSGTSTNTITSTGTGDIVIGTVGSTSEVNPKVTGAISAGTSSIYMHSGLVTSSADKVLYSSSNIVISGGKAVSTNTSNTSYVAYINENVEGKSLKVNGGKIVSNSGRAIRNSNGTIIIGNGEITTYRGINGEYGTVEMLGGTLKISTIAIYSSTGKVVVAGGKIQASAQAVYMYSSGTVEVKGVADITGTVGVTTDGAAIITVADNAKITATSGQGLNVLAGKATVTGGTINAKTLGVSVSTGEATVTGGTIIAGTYGVMCNDSGKVVIGTDDGTVSVDSPLIKATSTADNEGFALHLADAADCSFFDGKLIGKANSSIYGTVDVVPDGYVISKNAETIDGVAREVAYLEKIKVAIFDTGANVNVKMKSLSGSTGGNSGLANSNIYTIKESDVAPDVSTMSTNNIVSSTLSSVPIYMWYEENTIYWWSEAKVIKMNTNSHNMFYNFNSLKDTIGMTKWDTSSVRDMSDMFGRCTNLTDLTGLLNWDTSSVTDMGYMFSQCSSLTDLTGLSNLSISSGTDMRFMFDQCSSLKDLTGLSNWKIDRVELTNIFNNCTSLTDINAISNWTIGNQTSIYGMFYSCTSLTDVTALSNWDTSNVTNMTYVFFNCTALSNIDPLSKWDTSSVTNMSGMFANCRSLTNLTALSNWDTSSVTNMESLFNGCLSLRNLTALSNWDVSNVTNMNSLFHGCKVLLTVVGIENWDTSNVTSMDYMFYNCKELSGLYKIVNWDISSVTSFKEMCYNVNSPPNWNGTWNSRGTFTPAATTTASIENNTQTTTFSLRPQTTTTQQTNQSNTQNSQTQPENIEQTQPTPLAQIAETTYETLQSAINASNSEDEITILQDIALTEELTIPENKNIKLNLNNKTISSSSENVIKNNGTLTITKSGIIRNETSNGTVIYNTGTLNIENAIITTAQNGGKAVFNDSGIVNMISGKIVTEGISGIGIYNVNTGKVLIEDGIIEVTGTSSKCIYNDASLEITGGKIVVSGDDSIGIYNSDKSTKCIMNEVEILVEAEVIENYELIKNTQEFKAELEQMKPSYGIYNNSEINVEIETATIKVERLKGVGILNKLEGSVTLGIEDSEVSTATPIVYAISDNTTAIENSEDGNINFYDGRLSTLSSIKDVITKVLDGYELVEEIGENVVNATLKVIEVAQAVENTEAEGIDEQGEQMETTEVTEGAEATEATEGSEGTEGTEGTEITEGAEGSEVTEGTDVIEGN